MRRKYIFYTLSFLLISFRIDCFAQFRNIKWGVTKQQVIAVEGKPDYNNEDDLFYKNKSVGRYINVMTQFFFNSKKQFVHGKYTFTDFEHNIIKEIGHTLERKYGIAKVTNATDGTKIFQWSPKESHIMIMYDDVGFVLSYYDSNYWKELVKDEMRRRSTGL